MSLSATFNTRQGASLDRGNYFLLEPLWGTRRSSIVFNRGRENALTPRHSSLLCSTAPLPWNENHNRNLNIPRACWVALPGRGRIRDTVTLEQRSSPGKANPK